jgi:hypothetical protein
VSDVETVQLLLERQIIELALRMPAVVAGRLRVCMTRGGYTFTLEVAPAGTAAGSKRPIPSPMQPRNDCERDVLALFAGLPPGGRLTMTRAFEALGRSGRLHGESTLRIALARLTRAGLLRNDNDHRGYYLPGDEPNPPSPDEEKPSCSHASGPPTPCSSKP